MTRHKIRGTNMSVYQQTVLSEAELDSQVRDARRLLLMNAELVTRLMPEFDQVSITLVDSSGSFSTAAQVGSRVTTLDRLQCESGSSPGRESLRSALPVLAPRIRRDFRWGRYASSAAELGLKSQVAAPLRWREDNPLGVLNMYSTTQEDISSSAPMIAEALAAQIAGGLGGFQEIEHLRRALASRKDIGIAIGLLMAQHQLTENAAFQVLVRRSSHTNVKLRDIAAQVVAENAAIGLELPSAAIC